MSFADYQRIANNAFFTARIVSESIVYTPPGGAAETINAVFGDRPAVADGFDLAFATLNTSELYLKVRLADLVRGKLESGARVIATERGGVEYEVRALERPDETGVAVCTLRRVSGA